MDDVACLSDVCFITEETFDFGIDSPSDSRELCDASMAEEEEVFVGPVRHVERCVAKSIDLNVQGAMESQRAGGWGSKAGGDGGLLNWSPLSAEKLEEISREANRLASQLERTVLKENAGDGCQESPRVRALRDRQEPCRSPRRETYIVKDSPVKSLLPSVVPESGCPSPRPDAEGKSPAAKRRSRRTPGRAARTVPAQTVASPGPRVLPRCEGRSPAMSVPSSTCSLQPTSPSVPSPTQQAKRHSARSPTFIRLPAGDKPLPRSGTPSRTGKAADSETARQTVPSPLAQDSKNSLSKSSVSCPASAKPSPGRKTKSSTPSHSLPHPGHPPPARQKAPLVPGVAVGTERITPSGAPPRMGYQSLQTAEQKAVSSLTGPERLTVYTGQRTELSYSYSNEYYFSHRKYWCQGYYRNSCQVVAYADEDGAGADVQVQDDKENGRITVIINALSLTDPTDYWCGIERNHLLDIMAYTKLDIVEGPRERHARLDAPLEYILPFCMLGVLLLLVGIVFLVKFLCQRSKAASSGLGVGVAQFPQEMECRFGEGDRDKPKVWCKQNTTQCCSGFAVSSAEESLYGGQVTIRVLRDQNKFTVSIAQLPEGEGRYWCGVLNPDNTMVKLGEADFSDGETLEALVPAQSYKRHRHKTRTRVRPVLFTLTSHFTFRCCAAMMLIKIFLTIYGRVKAKPRDERIFTISFDLPCIKQH
ncbi:PSRC1 protein, partial [Atractosteus spatula]|nr:PSRC1 protein [Atractosteus spatula]